MSTITPPSIPQPASVRTVRSKLSSVEREVRFALRELSADRVNDRAVNALAFALDELRSADGWLDHCTDRR